MEIEITCDGTDYVDYRTLKPFQGDLKTLSNENLNKLKNSIIKYGFTVPAFVWENGSKWVLDAHQRIKALDSLFSEGYEIPDIPVVYIQAKDEKEAKEKLLHITSQYGEFAQQGFADFILEAGLDISGLNLRLTSEEFNIVDNTNETESYNLSDLFEANPFSVIDARTGEWLANKKKWQSILPNSKQGREENIINAPVRDYGQGTCENMVAGTSIFDPNLASVLYKWFCKDGGSILDPFAGGSVRGLVAGLKGYRYLGIDIRDEQIKENINHRELMRWSDIDIKPIWILGDSNKELLKLKQDYDMIFTCPPYADMEVYSDIEGDISNKEYNDFIKVYADIIHKCVDKLKVGGTAVFVI